MKNTSHKATIAYLTTFPPRECGIATFTRDLTSNFDKMYALREETKIIAMKIDENQHLHYPAKVIREVLQNNPEDYIGAALMLNEMDDVVLVAVEHEYGIYGEGFGKNLIHFMDKIKKPVSVTCHTVLPNPEKEMKGVMVRIIEKANIVVVMTETSKKILTEVYGASKEKVKVIPHGIHPAPYTDGSLAKKKLGLVGKKVISTFGFLSRGKGIEYGIEAMPEVVKKFPDAVYLVIGETHPVIKRKDGEEYREALMRQARELGVEENVHFVNKYLSTEELLKYLEVTDIYLSLSQNTDQAVSGTLSYALGAGRPVVATTFSQAREVITPDVGALVKVGESSGISHEVIALLTDEHRRIALGKNAYFRTRIMTWPNVALAYMREFAALAPSLARRERVLPPFSLAHLKRLTDDFGMFQFAILSEPDPAWGYTLDDNARALATMAWCANHRQEKKTSARLAKIYLGFIEKSAEQNGKFHNYFTSDKEPHDERNTKENLADSCARALWALAEASQSKLPWLSRRRARKLFKRQFKDIVNVSSPRAAAFVIKACSVWLLGNKDEEIKRELIEKANYLKSLFTRASHESWQWFEEILTYSNGVLPESLVLAYQVTGDMDYLDVARKSLDFLIEHSFDGEMAVPVGQIGWYRQGSKKHIYDQQPEEVSALVLALLAMEKATGDTMYEKKIENAFNWFLGNNVLHSVVYSEETGGCYDGISEKEVNLNQGAESTVAYLLARVALGGKIDKMRLYEDKTKQNKI